MLVFFLQDTHKTAFLNKSLNHRHTRTGHFFPKSEDLFCETGAVFFYSKKRARETSPTLPLVTRLLIWLFHDEGRYNIENSPLIWRANQWTGCRENQWTGFYMITASVIKELNLIWIKYACKICKRSQFLDKWCLCDTRSKYWFLRIFYFSAFFLNFIDFLSDSEIHSYVQLSYTFHIARTVFCISEFLNKLWIPKFNKKLSRVAFFLCTD